MRLTDYDPNGLSEYDRMAYREALEIRKDCNRWQHMQYLSTTVQNIELEYLLLEESDKMRHTLEFYEGIEE